MGAPHPHQQHALSQRSGSKRNNCTWSWSIAYTHQTLQDACFIASVYKTSCTLTHFEQSQGAFTRGYSRRPSTLCLGMMAVKDFKQNHFVQNSWIFSPNCCISSPSLCPTPARAQTPVPLGELYFSTIFLACLPPFCVCRSHLCPLEVHHTFQVTQVGIGSERGGVDVASHGAFRVPSLPLKTNHTTSLGCSPAFSSIMNSTSNYMHSWESPLSDGWCVQAEVSRLSQTLAEHQAAAASAAEHAVAGPHGLPVGWRCVPLGLLGFMWSPFRFPSPVAPRQKPPLYYPYCCISLLTFYLISLLNVFASFFFPSQSIRSYAKHYHHRLCTNAAQTGTVSFYIYVSHSGSTEFVLH